MKNRFAKSLAGILLALAMLCMFVLSMCGISSMVWMNRQGYLTGDVEFSQTAVIRPRITEAFVEAMDNFIVYATENSVDFTILQDIYVVDGILRIDICWADDPFPVGVEENACSRAVCYIDESQLVMIEENGFGSEVIFCSTPSAGRSVSVDELTVFISENTEIIRSTDRRAPFDILVDGKYYSEAEALELYARKRFGAYELLGYSRESYSSRNYDISYNCIPQDVEESDNRMIVFAQFRSDAFSVDEQLGRAKTLYDFLYPNRTAVFIATPLLLIGAIVIFFRLFGRKLSDLLLRVPVAVRSAVLSAAYIALCFAAVINGGTTLGIILLAVSIAASVLLCAFFVQFGVISSSLARNDDTVSVKGLFPGLRLHAQHINELGERITHAVNEQMKSERMQTELITNVSHDIKTPLTSIVNYVGLLSNEHIQSETGRQYLSVLNRQAVRLKRLVEDLVEAAKAVSGNIVPNFAVVNIKELVEQAVAEYEDRFSSAEITPVVTSDEGDISAVADGRLLWRVIDNLMSNICKYALPGTRAYIHSQDTGDCVEITVKNISAYELNISPDELMRRFVRGDSSRTLEGSGLGLSIAQSLTELQGGKFDIVIDGDLFKAVIRLERAEKETEE